MSNKMAMKELRRDRERDRDRQRQTETERQRDTKTQKHKQGENREIKKRSSCRNQMTREP